MDWKRKKKGSWRLVIWTVIPSITCVCIFIQKSLGCAQEPNTQASRMLLYVWSSCACGTYLQVSGQRNIAHVYGPGAESSTSLKRKLQDTIYTYKLVCMVLCLMVGMKMSALVSTWLACDILLDLLWRLAGSPSLILSMLQPHDSMVFRDSLTGQKYASLSWLKIKHGLKPKLMENLCCKFILASCRKHREMLQCFFRPTTLSESALYGFSKLWILEVSHICSPNDQPLENCKHTAGRLLRTGFPSAST